MIIWWLFDDYLIDYLIDYSIDYLMIIWFQIIIKIKSEAPKLSPNYVAGSSLGTNKILKGTL